MKKKIIAAAAAAALLISALGAALAAPGDGTDPFVTLSYLTGTYYAQAQQTMLERAQQDTAAVEKAAFDKLDALSGSYLAQAGGGQYADTFQRMILARGDRLDLPTGASLQFEAGLCELVFASGSLVDVTAGKPLASGGTLTAGHRYIAAENTACSVTAVSDAVYLSVRGRYVSDLTGMTYTPFTDLKAADWFYSAVCFAYEGNLFSGMTATTFSPDTNMNRAMLATVLSRMEGVNGYIPPVGFSDVAENAWFANAVNWAANAGIVTGSGGAFHPDQDVTREQLCTMLYRYAIYLGLDTTASGDLSGFTDRGKVSPYAVDAVTWAVEKGIVTGMTATTLSPSGTANRAQVATMLQRFCNLMT